MIPHIFQRAIDELDFGSFQYYWNVVMYILQGQL